VKLGRHDPGDCRICGAAHGSCGGTATIAIVQLPARDAMAVEGTPGVFGAPAAALALTLGDGSDGRSFSTATYRGTKKQP
jgi:hypothetical protein